MSDDYQKRPPTHTTNPTMNLARPSLSSKGDPRTTETMLELERAVNQQNAKSETLVPRVWRSNVASFYDIPFDSNWSQRTFINVPKSRDNTHLLTMFLRLEVLNHSAPPEYVLMEAGFSEQDSMSPLGWSYTFEFPNVQNHPGTTVTLQMVVSGPMFVAFRTVFDYSPGGGVVLQCRPAILSTIPYVFGEPLKDPGVT